MSFACSTDSTIFLIGEANGKSALRYDYPFDVGQIQSDMIAWSQAVGMTHEAGARSPDNSSWDNPITASESFQGDILRAKLQEYVQFYTSVSWQGYGNEPVTHFTIYVSGTTFYVLH